MINAGYRLKLVKGKSYWGCGVKASQEKPYVVVETKEHAERLLKSGHFVLDGFGNTSENVEEEAAGESAGEYVFPDEEDDESSTMSYIVAELQGKKKDELTQYAADHGIDITGCKTKDDMLSKIAESMEKAADARNVLRSDV